MINPRSTDKRAEVAILSCSNDTINTNVNQDVKNGGFECHKFSKRNMRGRYPPSKGIVIYCSVL